MHTKNVDLFICFWDYVNAHPKPTKAHSKLEDLNLLSKAELINDYSPTCLRLFDWKSAEDLIKPMSKLIEVSGLVGINGIYNSKSSAIVERTVGAAFLISQAFKMLEKYQKDNNVKYINVLRTRTEFGIYDLKGYYPKIDWDRDYSDAIYMPNWNFVERGNFAPITSVGAISSYENMKIYCNLLNSLPNIALKFTDQPKKCWGDEYCFALHLTENNLKWKKLK